MLCDAKPLQNSPLICEHFICKILSIVKEFKIFSFNPLTFKIMWRIDRNRYSTPYFASKRRGLFCRQGIQSLLTTIDLVSRYPLATDDLYSFPGSKITKLWLGRSRSARIEVKAKFSRAVKLITDKETLKEYGRK